MMNNLNELKSFSFNDFNDVKNSKKNYFPNKYFRESTK